MANPQNAATLSRNADSAPQTNHMTMIAPAAAWLLPGLGHLIQRRYIRGLLLMASIFTMFFVGLGMQGKIYSFNTGDLLDILGFVGQIGTGLLYVLAKLGDWGQTSVTVALGDYGTKFIVVAGLLNVVAAIDAHSLAIGRKPAQ